MAISTMHIAFFQSASQRLWADLLPRLSRIGVVPSGDQGAVRGAVPGAGHFLWNEETGCLLGAGCGQLCFQVTANEPLVAIDPVWALTVPPETMSILSGLKLARD
jgi:hypothetical protein